MANLNLSAITRRVDRLTGPTSCPPAIVVQFVRPGAEPQPPITNATCRDVRYTREPGESEQAFLDRIEAQHPPTRQGFTVILVRD